MISIFLLGLTIGVITSLPIGLLGSYIVQRVLEKGFWAGFFIALLAAVFDFFYCFVSLIGFHFLFKFSLAKIVCQFLGLIFLAYLGWKNFFGQRKFRSKRKLLKERVSDGLFVSVYYLANPTAFVFWFNISAVLHTYLFQEKNFFTYFLFAFFVFLGDLIANLFFLTLALRIKHIFSSKKIRKINGLIYFFSLFGFFLYLLSEVKKIL